MPATILRFPARDLADPAPGSRPGAPTGGRPQVPPLALIRSPALPAPGHTARQIAHRWAMLSHLTRHYSRRRVEAPPEAQGRPPDSESDPVR